MGSCSKASPLFPDPLSSFISALLDELESFAKYAHSELQRLVNELKTHWHKYVGLFKQPHDPNEAEDEKKARTKVSAEAMLLLLQTYSDKIKAVRDRIVAKINEIDADLLAQQLVRMLPRTKGLPKEILERYSVERVRGMIERFVGDLRGEVRNAEMALKHCGGLIEGTERMVRALRGGGS